MSEQIISFLEKEKDTVVELQKNLVSLPALGPENQGEGEKNKAEYLYDYLQKLPFQKLDLLPSEDKRVPSGQRPNIVAFLPGKDQKRTLWIISHLDVVPPGDLNLWDTEPFKLHQNGDYIFGRGVEDNHHGMVASILAARAFIYNNQIPKNNMGLLFVADEETGNKYGLDFIFREHDNLFNPEDAFLVPDFGTVDSSLVEVAEKSLLWLKFSLYGKQCHASTPEKGANTLLACSDLILKLRSLYQNFGNQNQMFSPACSTFEATKKEANVPNVNTISGKDVFYLDCRILPEYDLQEVIQVVKSICAEIEKEYQVKVEVEIVHQESSPPTQSDHPFVIELISKVSQVCQVQALAQGIGGGTVAAYPRKKGFPAAVWATLFGNAHQPNEFTSVQNIIKDAKVMSLVLS